MTDDKHQRESFLSQFDHQVLTNPKATALVFGDSAYSYAAIANRAAGFAASLARQGVAPGSKVAVGVARTDDLVPLLLAIWSLRAAYVPVDPSYPLPRQSYILDHSEANILVTSEPLAGLVFHGEVVSLSTLVSEPAAAHSPPALARADAQGSDRAYIIYTSGSTGNPKGVAVSQANVHSFLVAMADTPGITHRDRLLAVTTISFDIHVLELFLPLSVGAQILLLNKEDSASQSVLQETIDRRKVSIMQATPATWRLLLAHDWLPQERLKILIGGEPLPQDLRPALHKASSELWNMYGPTETTVWSTCHKIAADDEKIYIGRPISGTNVHVVNEQLQPLAHGAKGELLIGGAGVSQGYYKSAELTEERFVNLPDLSEGKLYRTGDAVIQHSDGVLEYVNRLDNQIKIRGFRIEPADVEHVLERHSAIAQAVVVASHFSEHDTRLIGFYCGQGAAASQLLKHCAEYLPAHMIPQHIVQLPKFPMTANLKVDRKQLTADGAALVEIHATEPTAPGSERDDLDRSLVAVWEHNLGMSGVGINDSFFELGGHSLLALQTTRDMCVATGLEFPETILFQAPTIRAAREQMGEQAERAASVMKLNKGQKGDPVFCLCGVQIYQDLADQFAESRPVYSVFAKKEIDLIDAQQANSKIVIDFDSLVQSYVDAIKRQGEFKKLSLIGLSFGGLVALEAADRFRKEGVEVEHIIMLDSYFQGSSYRSLRKLAQDMLKQLRQTGFHSLRRDLAQRVSRQLNRRRQNALRYLSMREAEGEREKAFESAATYFDGKKKSYKCNALLIKASRTEFGFGLRPKFDYGLRGIIKGNLQIRKVPAVHTSMMREESVPEVYKIIEQYMKLKTNG